MLTWLRRRWAGLQLWWTVLQLERAHHQLQQTIGQALLPAITEAVTAAAKELSQ